MKRFPALAAPGEHASKCGQGALCKPEQVPAQSERCEIQAASDESSDDMGPQ